MTVILVEAHPLLEAVCFETTFPAPLGALAEASELTAYFVAGAEAPFASSDEIRAAVRRLLRHGGYRPTGRGKPASEYLIGAVERGALQSINAAVDACNTASLHSGLPISVVDLDRTVAPLRIAVAPEGSRYVFNTGGQEIELAGLLCLADADGPCANAVKDAQRTKTDQDTTRTLSVVWGTSELAGRAQAVATWYRALLGALGASTRAV